MIEIAEIDFDNIIPVKETKATLWAKISSDKIFDRYPAWMEEIEIPQGTVPSLGSHQYCYSALNKLREKEKLVSHPINNIRTWSETSPVIVTPKEVTVGTTKYPVRMTFPGTSQVELKAAIISNIVSYTTTSSAKGTDVVNFPSVMKVPIVNLTHLKAKVLKNTEEAATEVQSSIYRSIVGNERVCDLAMNCLGEYPNFVQSPAITRRFGKPMKSICQINANYPKAGEIKNAYKYKQCSEGIRGSGAGVGNLSVSYTTVAMTRREQKISSLVRDLLNFMKAVRKDVLVIDCNIDEVVKESAALSILIEDKNCLNGKEYVDQVCGEFYSIGSQSRIKYMSSRKELLEPIMSSLGLTYRLDNEKVFYKKLELSRPAFAIVPITINIPDNLYTFPVGMADSLEVIVSTEDTGLNYTIEEYLKRGTTAISCRNFYPLYYIPFCSIELMREYDWDIPITIPQSQERKLTHTLDLGEADIKIVKTLEDIPDVTQAFSEDIKFKWQRGNKEKFDVCLSKLILGKETGHKDVDNKNPTFTFENRVRRLCLNFKLDDANITRIIRIAKLEKEGKKREPEITITQGAPEKPSSSKESKKTEEKVPPNVAPTEKPVVPAIATTQPAVASTGKPVVPVKATTQPVLASIFDSDEMDINEAAFEN